MRHVAKKKQHRLRQLKDSVVNSFPSDRLTLKEHGESTVSGLGSWMPHRAPRLRTSLVPTCRLTYPVCVYSLSSRTPRSAIKASHRVILTQRTQSPTREAGGPGTAYPATTFNNQSVRQVTKLPFSSCQCRRSSLTSIFSSIQHALGNDVMFLN
ncbi:unnamed protein product [Rangifer tarandus platyrhynchus]|uniref:Uncharacterized protein n=2 Tax=Rangifer tarandus platyrhynchus TaxID=3082113 RepID=A0ABN8ZYV9_RANTA|nr:unnamed protein product [Rangifer tarandus platyrhynchus]